MREPLVTPKRTVLVVGEALIDIVEEGDREEEFVGGSPANTAIGIARQGHTARLLSCLGRDARGERIAAHLGAESVELLEESWSAGSTSTARARIEPDGGANYVFELEWTLPPVALPAPDLMHVGSLGLYLEPGGAEVLRLLRELPEDCLVTVDPNARPSIMHDRGSAVEIFERAARHAHLVKLSDEDSSWLYPGRPVEEVLEHLRSLGPRIAVMTLGADGACGLSDAGYARVAAVPVEVVDTISAGDSFMATLVVALLEQGLDAVAAELGGWLHRAACASAIAVSEAGANPPFRQALDTLHADALHAADR